MGARTMPCPAPILIAAFAAERVKCQNLLTPSLHPAAAPSRESAPDAYSLGSRSFSDDKSLQLQWPQELLRAAPAGNLPLYVSGAVKPIVAPPQPAPHKGPIFPAS